MPSLRTRPAHERIALVALQGELSDAREALAVATEDLKQAQGGAEIALAAARESVDGDK